MGKSHPFLDEGKEGVYLRILVTPKAKRTRVVGLHGDRLKISIKAPPVDGKANKELVAFLAKSLSVSKSSISLEGGQHSREKLIFIEDATLTSLTPLLDEVVKNA